MLFITGDTCIPDGIDRKPRHDVARQQLLLGEQPGILERLEIRQLAQRVDPELRQKGFGRHIGIGRAGLRGPEAIRSCARNTPIRSRDTSLPKKLDSSPRVIGWK